jgi:O-antigen/teichoic acid export membrane protein
VLAYVMGGAYQHAQVGILLSKKTKFILYMQIIGAAAGIALNVALVPILGAWGAATATLSAWTLLTVLAYKISRRYIDIRFELGRIGKMMLVALLLYGLCLRLDVTSSAYVNLVLKLAVSALFPLALVLLRFYEPEEIDKIREIASQVWSMMRRRLGWGGATP